MQIEGKLSLIQSTTTSSFTLTSPEGYAGYNYYSLSLCSMYMYHFMHEFNASLRPGIVPTVGGYM